MLTAVRTRRAKRIITPAPLPSAVVGRLVGRTAAGEPLVDFPGNPADEPVPARAATAWTADDIGSEVALTFAAGSPAAPLLLGVLRPPVAGSPMQVSADGQTLTLTAAKRIELKCGEASITLTAAGKVIIRGTYVLSRSSGANRIKGAAVEIN